MLVLSWCLKLLGKCEMKGEMWLALLFIRRQGGEGYLQRGVAVVRRNG